MTNAAKDKTGADDELLDLVDENDKIIGTVLKSEANRNPKLIHREAAVLIYDNQKRLLQQRSHSKIVNPGLWAETCAGHIFQGEDPTDAAHRELKEELGFGCPLTFIEKIRVNDPNEPFWAGDFDALKI